MSNPHLVLLEVPPPNLSTHESWSPFCTKVHRALRLLELPYERRFAANPASFAKYNPRKQVPVLLVEDEPVYDSTVILRRLERIAGVDLAPTDPRLAAEAWLWEELADTSLNGFVVASRWADDENWPRAREAFFGEIPALVRSVIANRLRGRIVSALAARDHWREGARECWARFDLLLDRLEARAPEHGAWIGDRIGLADVALFGQLHAFRTPLTPAQRDAVAARPRLSAWLDRVDAATTPFPKLAVAA